MYMYIDFVSSVATHMLIGVTGEAIGLFCRILSLLQVSFAKETYNLIDPTNQSHPMTGEAPQESQRLAGTYS